ncbi:MAG TPA: DUF1552 domain-containing protein [Polyangiaceae bacterium]|nr:DUF1552 domain-containing protein [Polyangiaceae bacterium]
MNPHRLRSSRRRFLTSVGATAAMLPFLRNLPSYAQGAAPTKLVLVFSPNGRIRHLWGADTSSGAMTFRQNLTPLQPYAQNIVVTEGIRNYAAPVIGGTHEGGMKSLFTGSAEGMTGDLQVKYPSIDTTFMAQATGTARSDSLYQQVIGWLNTAENASPDNRCVYDASGTARDPLKSCWDVMDQYMAGAVMSMSGPSAADVAKANARSAMFDALNKQMSALLPRLCTEDNHQLQAMQDALSKANQTITQVSCTLPTIPTEPTVTNGGPPVWAPPENSIDFSMSSHWYRDRSRLAIDLLVAALACGVTRSGVIQYDQAASNAQAVGQSMDHHNTSHTVPMLQEFIEMLPVMPPDYQYMCLDHEDDPTASMLMTYASAWSQLSVWENYYAEEFAYLVSQLQAHGVLDDTLVVWGSEIDSSNGHQHYNMPFLLAAGQNIPVKRGSVVSFPMSYSQPCVATTGTSPSHNDFLRTVLHAVGVDATSVGSTTGTDNVNMTSVTLNQGMLTDLLTTST